MNSGNALKSKSKKHFKRGMVEAVNMSVFAVSFLKGDYFAKESGIFYDYRRSKYILPNSFGIKI